MRQEIERAEMENLVADRHARAKMMLRMGDSEGAMELTPKVTLSEMRKRRERRLKAALYGMDESLNVGLEMVENDQAWNKVHDETS